MRLGKLWIAAVVALAALFGFYLASKLRRAGRPVESSVGSRGDQRPEEPVVAPRTKRAVVVLSRGLAAAVLVLALVVLSAATPAPFTGSNTVMATEDTFVEAGESDRLGQEVSLEADATPTTRSLVRFQVTGVPAGATVVRATMRLWTVDGSDTGGEVRNVIGNWSESTTTWANAPTVGARVADLLGQAQASRWVISDVTGSVRGNGVINFYLTTSSTNGVAYLSSEGGLSAPNLSVYWNTEEVPSPSPTATPSPQPTPTPGGTPTPTPRVTLTPPPSATATPSPQPTPQPTTGATPAPTSTTPPSGTPDPNFQPAAPIQAAFMYPWFPNAWNQGGIQPFSRYTPSYGYYSSTDNAIIDQQLQLASRAHLEAFISSWWGQGQHTDVAFKHILARSERAGSPAPNMRWSLYYEPEGYGDPAVDQIVADLNYMKTNYFGHTGFLKINGKPVIFVWAQGSDSCAMADRWEQAANQFGNVHVVLKLFSGYLSCPSQSDSWHQYGPASAYHEHLPNSVNVSPGFWHINEATAQLGRDPVRFEADVKRMVTKNALWHLVTSWNEWGEGTGIEPTTQFGNTYIDILCRNLPGTTRC